MTDLELLREYAQTGSEEAFAQIVRLHVDMVYSTAHRQLRDATLAEDVTQRVFIALARKASKLKREVLLGGWLYNAAVLASHDARRAESRRSKREEKAADMAREAREAATSEPKASDADWSAAESILDEALAKLRPSTRGLLVATFWEGKTAREVGQRLGISEEAVRKRVSRAVDELREIFARKGVALTSVGLSEALAVKALLKAPSGLAASTTTAATAAATTTASTGAIGAGTLIMAATKAKVAATLVIGVILLGGGVVGTVQVVKHWNAPPGRTITLANAGIVRGIVRGADGKPAANVTIYVATPQFAMNVYGSIRKGAQTIVTGPDGHYELLKPQDVYELLVREPQGFAEVSGKALDTSGDFSLQPWGRIEGRVMDGSQPQANAPLQLDPMRSSDDPYSQCVYQDFKVKTDAQGRYVFPQVAPGEMYIGRSDPKLPNWPPFMHEYAIVDPGKTTTLNIGGVGRAVVGRIDAGEMPEPMVWSRDNNRRYISSLYRDRGPLAGGANHKPGETPEQYRAAEVAYGRTPLGHEAKRWVFARSFDVAPDGSFRVEDLAPGSYFLSVSVTELDKEVEFLDEVASARTPIMVLPMPGGRSDTPQEVGTLALTLTQRLHKGEVAPSFDFVTLDGTHHALSDFSGRYVLIYFWSTGNLKWQRSDVEAFQKEVRPWLADSRLAVLWLEYGGPEGDVAAAAKSVGFEGMITHVPSLPDPYRACIGTGMLISPDGKLAQNYLMSRTAAKILKKYLPLPAATQPGQLTLRPGP